MKQYTFNNIKLSLLYSIAAVLTAAAVSSCHKDEVDIVDLTAYVADDYTGSAKVSIDASQYACWENGDEVNVNGKVYPITVSGSYKTATIVGVEKNDNSDYTAVYPASCAGEVVAGRNTVTITLPSTQTWDANHIFSPMVATYNGGQLNFHNPCNLLAVTVTNNTGNTLMVHSIIVESTVNNITGTFTVSGCDGVNPTTVYTGDGGKTIMLDCGNQAVGESAVFYVSVPKVENEIFHFSVNAKTVVNTTTTKYTFAKDSRELTITNNKYIPITVATNDAAVTNDPYFWGKGSPEYPYLIMDDTDLKNLRNLVSHINLASYDDDTYNTSSIYYLQTANVDITSETTWGQMDESINYAIGCYYPPNKINHPFNAHYNGGGHSVSIKISNIGGKVFASDYCGIALFAAVGGGGSIKNLTTEGSIADISRSLGFVSGIVGSIIGPFTIENCTNEVRITVSTQDFQPKNYGGIVGRIETANSSDRVIINNCKNTSSLSISSRSKPESLGGICGFIKKGVVEFQFCTNEASIGGTGNNDKKIGGICGNSYVNVTFNGCINTSAGVIQSNKQYAGGILGYATASCTMTNCQNSATVTGTTEVGGIVGGIKGSSASITSCVNNEGATVTGSTSVGGIVGKIAGNSSELSSCTNNGDVTGTGPDGPAGGIAGLFSGGSISSCTNNGSVSGTQYVGGIVGKNSTNEITIDNSTNKKSITASTGVAGGMIGGAEAKYALSSCTNDGSINPDGGGYTIGGMVGFSTLNTSTFTDCINKQPVKGVYSVGGILGKGKCSSLTRCVNKGAISATGSAARRGVAGLIGTLDTLSAMTITSCKNNAIITFTNDYTKTTVGGLVGYATSQVKIYNSCNKGNVTAANKCRSIAGLVGLICHAEDGSEIVNSYCSGNVNGSSLSSNTEGGIGGLAFAYKKSVAKVENCYFGGTLSIGSSSKYGDMVGFNGDNSSSSYIITSNTNTYSTTNTTNRTTQSQSSALYTFSDSDPYTTTNSSATLLDALNDGVPSGFSTWKQTGSDKPHLVWEEESWAQ